MSANVPVKVDNKSTAPSQSPHATSPNAFDALHRQINQLFAAFDRNLWTGSFGWQAFNPASQIDAALPAVDIVEKGNAYEITADFPGLDEKNVEVKIDNGSLIVRGETKEEKEVKKEDYFLQERRSGSFARSFAIPNTVDSDKITASLAKGVLTVTLPKKQDAEKPAKKIEVKAA